MRFSTAAVAFAAAVIGASSVIAAPTPQIDNASSSLEAREPRHLAHPREFIEADELVERGRGRRGGGRRGGGGRRRGGGFGGRRRGGRGGPPSPPAAAGGEAAAAAPAEESREFVEDVELLEREPRRGFGGGRFGGGRRFGGMRRGPRGGFRRPGRGGPPAAAGGEAAAAPAEESREFIEDVELLEREPLRISGIKNLFNSRRPGRKFPQFGRGRRNGLLSATPAPAAEE